MMTSTTTSFDIDPHWNDMLWDELFDVDELIAETSNLFSQDIDDPHGIFIDDGDPDTPTLPTIDHDQSTSTETQLPNLICRVCGAPAHGYNFDQITCESCKAFFRRNALRSRPNLKCRFGGSCVIDVQTRRQCTFCRLKKCFDMNMRKDWIRTEEEVQLRQLQKLAKEQKKSKKSTDDDDDEPLPNLPLVVRTKKKLKIQPTGQNLVAQSVNQIRQNSSSISRILSTIIDQLSNDDRTLLNNITNAYQSISEQAIAVRRRQFDFPRSLVKFINNETEIHQSLIQFYKLLPEFKQLDITNQVLLIKSNLVKIIHLHRLLIDQFRDDPTIASHMTRWVGDEFHRGMTQARHSFHRFIEHPLILKLALIIFIFIMDLSVPRYQDSSDEYTHQSDIRACQDLYTNLLWRYLMSIQGEREAIQSMNIIVTQILRYQTLMNVMEESIRRESDRESVNQLEVTLFRLKC